MSVFKIMKKLKPTDYKTSGKRFILSCLRSYDLDVDRINYDIKSITDIRVKAKAEPLYSYQDIIKPEFVKGFFNYFELDKFSSNTTRYKINPFFLSSHGGPNGSPA